MSELHCDLKKMKSRKNPYAQKLIQVKRRLSFPVTYLLAVLLIFLSLVLFLTFTYKIQVATEKALYGIHVGMSREAVDSKIERIGGKAHETVRDDVQYDFSFPRGGLILKVKYASGQVQSCVVENDGEEVTDEYINTESYEKTPYSGIMLLSFITCVPLLLALVFRIMRRSSTRAEQGAVNLFAMGFEALFVLILVFFILKIS